MRKIILACRIAVCLTVFFASSSFVLWQTLNAIAERFQLSLASLVILIGLPVCAIIGAIGILLIVRQINRRF